MSERHPVILFSGFLGSGKTTLINRLLGDARLADSAVIVNEFGDIAIDHLLVESAIENTLILRNGCICCGIRGDLVDTLTSLHERSRRGEIPGLSRILIETTGLAEPAPIAAALGEGLLASRFRLRALVTTVDAVNGGLQLSEYPEAAKQIAAAGLVILTKADLANSAATEDLRGRISALNPTAEIRQAVHGELDAGAILDAPAWEFRTGDAARWLPASVFRAPATERGPFHAEPCAAVAAVSLTADAPVRWEALERWLDALISLRGRDVLRLKGLVNVEGQRGPRVVHGAQHLLHLPKDLPEWPDGDRRTRLVVICRDIAAAGLRHSFATALSA